MENSFKNQVLPKRMRRPSQSYAISIIRSFLLDEPGNTRLMRYLLTYSSLQADF